MNNKKNKDTIRKEVVNTCLGLGIITLAGIVGYNFGAIINELKIQRGLNACFAIDPGLYERMKEDVNKINGIIK